MSKSDDSVEATTSSPVPQGMVSSPLNQWLLMDANRWVVAGLFSTAVFVVFLALGFGEFIHVSAADPTTLLLSVFIGGNLTLVPITITINQLVLSREFGKPHDLNRRDEGVRELRRNLKQIAGTPQIDPTPKAFIALLAETMEECAETVTEAVDDVDDESVDRQLTVFQQEISESTEQVTAGLDGADYGSYELLSSMLKVNSAWLIGIAEQLRHGHDESMPDEPFERMEKILRLFNVTRQYTKTLYAQRELATLSRLMLYTGFLAVLLSSLGMLTYAPGFEPVFTGPARVVAFSVVAAVVFLPLAFLLSYMLRLSTLVSYPPIRNSFITDG